MQSFLQYHFLTLYSLYTQAVLILTLINVQYLQNVVFSFENGLNGQNLSSSDSYHLIFPPAGGDFPLSLVAIWTTLTSSTFQTPKIWHKKGSHCSFPYLLILNVLTNSSSYEAKKLCEKPSSNVSLFELKNLVKKCLSHVWKHRSFNIHYIYIYTSQSSFEDKNFI